MCAICACSPNMAVSSESATADTRQSRQRGARGHSEEFVEQVPPELICLICGYVAREPHHMVCCKKIYCRTCIEDLATNTDKCPNCHKKAQHAFNQHGAAKIKELLVRCPNTHRGCSWIGELEDLELHNRAKCGKALVKCRFHEIGCSSKYLREERENHEDEFLESHISYALDALTTLKKSHSKLKTEINELRKSNRDKEPLAVFKMEEFAKHKAERECWYSPHFLSHNNGYKMCLRVDVSGVTPYEHRYVSVFVCLMQGENDDGLVWPFRGSVTIELLNQAADAHHHKQEMRFESREPDPGNSRVFSVVSGTGRGWPKFISHAALEWDPTANRQYLKNDCLFFRITQVEVYESNKPWLTCTS